MVWFLKLILLALLKNGHGQELAKCNGTVMKLQLCTPDSDYNSGTTAWKKLGYPVTLKSSLIVHKIAEFDERHNTITLNFVLSVVWEDPRLSLESNDPNR